MAEYQVNKGIGRSPEFEGLKSQYLFIRRRTLALFVIFVVMYMTGIDQWVCIWVPERYPPRLLSGARSGSTPATASSGS